MHAHNATYLLSIQWELGLEILLSRDPQIGPQLESAKCAIFDQWQREVKNKTTTRQNWWFKFKLQI